MFSDFENTDDCIGRIISKLIRLRSVFIQKKIRKKMRNSGNCIYDYAHVLFEEDFQSNALYWCLNKPPYPVKD